MSDLIDRQAAIDAAREWYNSFLVGGFMELEKRLKQLPSAFDMAIEALKQPERKKGHWQHAQNNLFICSNCGRGYLEGRYDKDNPICTAKFCYNCGCKMGTE